MPAPSAPTPTQRALEVLWREILGTTDPIAPEDGFFDLGGDSLMAVNMLALVESSFGVMLPTSGLVEDASLGAVAAAIDAHPHSAPSAGLVRVRPGTLPPLFWVHDWFGGVMPRPTLWKHLDSERPVFEFQARGIDGKARPQHSIRAMARWYLALMRGVQPRGPYLLGGYSFGGLVAFEMARQLDAGGEPVAWLAMVDVDCPPPRPLQHRAVTLARRALRRRGPAALEDAFTLALREYDPSAFGGAATFFKARDSGLSRAPWGWEQLCLGGLRVIEVPGTHYTVVSPENIDQLGRELAASLDDLTVRSVERATHVLEPAPHVLD